MRRVHGVFLDLQPVALPQGRRAGDLAVAGQVPGVEHREIGLLVRRAHIGEDQPLMLVHRIGAVEQPVLQGAVGRLARGFEDRPVAIEQPAMIAAADALVADQPEFERGPAMRAMQFEEADRAALVAKRDQVLAEDAQPPRHRAQFARQDHRLPEAPQIFAARRPRPNPGQFLVHRRPLAMMIGAIGVCSETALSRTWGSSTTGDEFARPTGPRSTAIAAMAPSGPVSASACIPAAIRTEFLHQLTY